MNRKCINLELNISITFYSIRIMVKIYQDPLEMAINHLGKKWTIKVMRDISEGIKHFNEILDNNEGLTPKVLSNRLKLLQGAGIIEKLIVSKNPVSIEYIITDRVDLVNRLLYELALFTSLLKPGIIFEDEEIGIENTVKTIGTNFNMDEKLIALDCEIR